METWLIPSEMENTNVSNVSNFARSPFKTPTWKAPTFPPSGGDTSSVAYALGLANGHTKSVLLAQHGT